MIVARLLPTRAATCVVGQAEVLDELLVRGGLLERVELLALEVLDQRLLERGAVVGARARARGSSAARPGAPPASVAPPRSARSRRPPPARAPAAARPTSRIESASDAERLLVEVLARLIRVRPDRRDRDLLEPAARRLRCRPSPGRDQRAESPTQPAGSRHGSPPWPARGTRWRPARSSRTR